MSVIQRGDADVVITGSSEAALVPITFAGFNIMKALSTRNEDPTRASRPFDKDRDGFVVGEGAGILILEREDHARARGAHIYGEFAGYGMTADTNHVDSFRLMLGGFSTFARDARTLIDGGYPENKVVTVQGMGASAPFKPEAPTDPINRRIAIIVLKKSVEDALLGRTGDGADDPRAMATRPVRTVSRIP